MPVEDLRAYLVATWPRIKEDLLAGRYRPAPVRGVEIPKPGGGKRLLGIPTVLDRLIQQAMHQVLMPLFDPGFSGFSFGFRPGRSAHQAVLAARLHIAAGRRFGVDIDPKADLPAAHEIGPSWVVSGHSATELFVLIQEQ